MQAAPVSSLLSQGRCDIADSRALLRQNDVLHVACQSTGSKGPKTNLPRPEGIQLTKDYNIEDGVGGYFHDVCTEGSTMALMVDATRRYIEEK